MTDQFEIIPTTDGQAGTNPPTKWLWYLLYLHIGNLVLSCIPPIWPTNPVTPWIGSVLYAGMAVCLFRLTPACSRYRKAAIFTGISLVLTLLVKIPLLPNLLTMAASVLAIISSYQELYAHAQVVEPKDAALSRKWRNLFIWELVIGVISGFFSAAAVTIMVLADMELEQIVSLITGAMVLVALIPSILRILYLRKTIRLFET